MLRCRSWNAWRSLQPEESSSALKGWSRQCGHAFNPVELSGLRSARFGVAFRSVGVAFRFIGVAFPPRCWRPRNPWRPKEQNVLYLFSTVYYPHDAVDNLTFRNHSMSSDLTSLSVVFGRNTTGKTLDPPALDGTNPIRSVVDALLFDLTDF